MRSLDLPYIPIAEARGFTATRGKIINAKRKANISAMGNDIHTPFNPYRCESVKTKGIRNKSCLTITLEFPSAQPNSMKKLTGLETARLIRQSKSTSACRIVFVTSADDHDQFMQVKRLQVICNY